MLIGNFKLEKLKIYAYKDATRTGSKTTFEVMFNPESYSLQYKNIFASKYQGINTSGREANYILSKPQDLSLVLILDKTGVNRNQSKKSITDQVDKFLKATCYMDGQIHEPRYLKLEWGELIFDCRLSSVDIKYTLFARNGQPLRAELNTAFVGEIQNKKRVRKEGKNSPDLTHARTVYNEDNLPLMTHRIYGNPALYIQVATANQLNSIRNLKPGSNLIFPPLIGVKKS